jgi:outer membrane lipoprotein-sorting protein
MNPITVPLLGAWLLVASAPDPAAPAMPAMPATPAAPVTPAATEIALDARTIVKGALDYWRDTSSFSEIAMTIHRPDWERTSVMRSWTRGDKDALVRFVEPVKDAGSATLKLGDDMWIYTPKLDRVVKLPFSMMAQSWMGSDFSYNDLARSDELLVHFDSRIIGQEESDGHRVTVIEAVPHANAPVIWGKETLRIRDDHVMLEETYFDQDLRPVKTLKATDIAPVGGKIFAKTMRMEMLDEPGHWTGITYRQAEFGRKLPDALFTLANLRNPRAEWERP